MKNFVFVCEYECEAVLSSQEYGCAEHTHIKVSKEPGSE